MAGCMHALASSVRLPGSRATGPCGVDRLQQPCRAGQPWSASSCRQAAVARYSPRQRSFSCLPGGYPGDRRGACGGQQLPQAGLLDCHGSAASAERQCRRQRGRPLHSQRPADAGGPAVAEAAPGSAKRAVLTLPTLLTLARVAAIPAVVAAWFAGGSAAPAACTALFVAACLTDYVDGYLARKMDAATAFGAFLDPVADKLMVATVLVLLCTRPLPAGPAAGNAWLLPVLTAAIIGREITMSALREWAASLGQEAHSAVAVSSWGKWKTATQMVAVSLLLATSGGAEGAALHAAAVAGPPLLCVAAFLTVWSLAEYFRGLWRFL